MPDANIQKITVEVIPGSPEKPVINASQFDIGRPFEIDLTWGGNDYTVPEGVYVEIHVKKPDRTIVTASPDSIDGNACLFFTTEQMCACYGSNECEINLSDENDSSIGTGNFILEVEKDPILGGIESESEINTLQHQIDEIISGEGYLKSSDVAPVALTGDYDDLINKPDLSDYYTKTQTDNLLSLKANRSSVYTKSEVDSALSLKADLSAISTVGRTGDYDDLIDKPDINAMINAALLNVMPVETAGPSAIASFETDIETDLTDVTCSLSPSLTGYTAVNLTACGVNLWDEDWEVGDINSSTGENEPSSTNIRSTNYIMVKPSTGFYFYAPNQIKIRYYGIDKAFISGGVISNNAVITMPNDAYYIRFSMPNAYGTTYNNDISINYPSSDTNYHAYTGNAYTIALGDTYYGGTLDVTTGVLTLTQGVYTFTGNESITPISGERFRITISDYAPNISRSITATDLPDSEMEVLRLVIKNQVITNENVYGLSNEGQNLMYLFIRIGETTTTGDVVTTITGKKMRYPLATPVEIQLTPTAVRAITGQQMNVFADTGDTTVKYKVSIQKYVDDQ